MKLLKTTDACAIESGNFYDTAVRASWKLVCDVLVLPLLHSAHCVNYLVDWHVQVGVDAEQSQLANCLVLNNVFGAEHDSFACLQQNQEPGRSSLMNSWVQVVTWTRGNEVGKRPEWWFDILCDMSCNSQRRSITGPGDHHQVNWLKRSRLDAGWAAVITPWVECVTLRDMGLAESGSWILG